MVEVIIVVRELGRVSPDYSLSFELPAVPNMGSYISINRPDHREPYSEDLIVRKVWWRLHHPETRATVPDGEQRIGKLTEIFVECDVAVGPYATDRWRHSYSDRAEKFEIERFSVPESTLNS